MIWGFTSDQHFGHHNIIEHAERPFSGLTEMHEVMIERYNAIVPEDALVVHVGDVIFRGSHAWARAILARLNGRKILVRGNHDRGFIRCHNFGFEVVVDELHMSFGDRQVRVNHFGYAFDGSLKYPDRFKDRRPPRVKGEVLVHGHTHSPKQRQGNQIHIGVDAWDFAPVPLGAVEALVREI